jgi:2-polyprenyl-3-methyl-5-hydroxy-6-metoxy-1,4-benzoquinol methylase
MSSRYHERVWESVPDGAQPAELTLRLAFALERLRAAGASSVVGSTAPGAAGAPLRVLDVGCGEAQITAELARAGFDVLGVDVAEEPLRRARRRHAELDLRLVAEVDWPLPDASFDAVWSGETLEHVLDTSAWLSEVRRVLRPRGTLVLSTPAHEPLMMLGLSLWPRAFARHFQARSDHLRFYNRRMLQQLLADFGFEQLELRGAGGLPGARRVLLASAVRARF